MKVQQAYTSWAGTYDSDRNLTRDLDEQVTSATLGHLRFNSVVEIGCGTGKNTALFATISKQVQAVDFTAAMIRQARQKAAFANVNFILADLTKAWPVSHRSIDLISCNLVLEHLSDVGFVFAEAARVLVVGGQFFVSELHPFRQYQGVQARFEHEGDTIAIPAFVHHVSDFLQAAESARLSLQRLDEWWHAEDDGKPPRLISFMFRKED